MEFEGQMLKVYHAPEPSLILWENLGVSKCERRCRVFINVVVSMVFIISAILIILTVKVMQKHENTQDDSRDCDSYSESYSKNFDFTEIEK